MSELDLALDDEPETPDAEVAEEQRDKAVIIEYIYDDLLDEKTGELSRTVVTSADIQQAKRFCVPKFGLKLKVDGQAFNFFKDIVRQKGAQRAWPSRLRRLGWTGEQRTGGGAVFEFVRITDERPDNLAFDLGPTTSTPRSIVQTLSIPLAAKALGRRDESWLLQSAVNLRIIETHFASGVMQLAPLSLTHLQMDIKLRRTQIDALYHMEHRLDSGAVGEALVTLEAKQHNQRILIEQIAWQAAAAFNATNADIVIPMALSAIKGEGMYVAEFELVRRGQNLASGLKLFRDGLYLLRPVLKGI